MSVYCRCGHAASSHDERGRCARCGCVQLRPKVTVAPVSEQRFGVNMTQAERDRILRRVQTKPERQR